MRPRSFVLALVASLNAFTSRASAAELGYYSQPALHGERIVFVSEGDLWSASLAGFMFGEDAPIIAHRLTSSEGSESRPTISPDGQWIAFSGQYDGNTDVYVMPIDGGSPRRLTFHPAADVALTWSADSQHVFFSSARAHQFGRPELWRVSLTGGMPTRYEMGECSAIQFSSTGRRAAFTRWSNEHWTWKRYRGGTAPEIWAGDLAAGQFAPLTSNTANDLFPMWLTERVFFVSDRSGTMNIYSVAPSMDQPESDLKQHTTFAPVANNPTAPDGYDVRWPSADVQRRGTRIIFCQAGGLALLDTTNNSIARLNVQLASDRIAARQRFAPLNDTITEFTLSPDGKSIYIGSRGEILRVDIERDVARQLTHSSGSREWGIAPLNDDRLALISDTTGEQQVIAISIEGSEAPMLITSDREDWLFPPATSPDGRYIAYADKTLRLHVMDMMNLQQRLVDESQAGEIRDYRFSPDSQWLAYTRPMPNGLGEVRIYSLRTSRSFAISNPLHDDSHPRWDPAGKYLYLLSQRHINPTMGAFDFEHVLVNTTQVYAVPLASDTPPPIKSLALAAGFDLEQWAKSPEAEPKNDPAGADAAENDAPDDAPAPQDRPEPPDPNAPPPGAIRIDTDNIALRQYQLPIEPGNYSQLEATHGGLLFMKSPLEGLLDDPWPNPAPPKSELHRFTFIKEETKKIADKIARYAFSRDARTVAYPTYDEQAKITGFTVIAATGEGEPKSVKIAGHQLRIDTPAEWKQILAEAWRLQRDFYWAPNYLGVNWPAMRTKYEALLPRIGSRTELNDLVGQLIGELGTSHTYVWGGQEPRQIKPLKVGLLGADVSFDGQGFRIARIIPGQKWGDEELVSPLEAPHLNIREGNYILAINGVRLQPNMSIYELLQDQAEKIVRLTIADDARGTNTRNAEVKTLSDEQPLRYAAWVEANRQYVAEKSEGQLGYLHIPDMGGQGLMMFSRYFYPQYNKTGLVIDVRDNGGGFVSQMIVQRLARKPIAFDQPRHGVTGRYPNRALNAHLVTLIDQHAGSDGDIFPATFRMLGLGPLIGTRTWGGVVGIRGDKPFVDLGLSTQPEFAWWDTTGGWTIENQGVSPDIEVDITPADRAAGRDPQLDRAIEYLLQKLKDEPKDLPKPPAWPVRMPSAH